MGYSSPSAPSVKMRTLLAFAVALAATTAFELTKTNYGGYDRAIFYRPVPEDISYGYRSSVDDGYTNFGYDIVGSYFSPRYEDDSSEDTDISGEEAEVQILDNGLEDGPSQEHTLSRRSPQDPNSIYQIPLFKTLGKGFKKAGKKSPGIKLFSKDPFRKLVTVIAPKKAKLGPKFPVKFGKFGKKTLGKKGKPFGKRSAEPLIFKPKTVPKFGIKGLKLGGKLGKIPAKLFKTGSKKSLKGGAKGGKALKKSYNPKNFKKAGKFFKKLAPFSFVPAI